MTDNRDELIAGIRAVTDPKPEPTPAPLPANVPAGLSAEALARLSDAYVQSVLRRPGQTWTVEDRTAVRAALKRYAEQG